MASWARMVIWMWVTIGCAVSAIIHYRVGVAHLYPMATEEFTGPFSGPVETLEYMVPIALTLIILGVGIWAMAGGVQEEKARVRGRR